MRNYIIIRHNTIDEKANYGAFEVIDLTTSDTASSFFRTVSCYIAYEDVEDYVVETIVLNGYDIKYTGWQAGMRMEYISTDNGELIWSQRYMEYDH